MTEGIPPSEGSAPVEADGAIRDGSNASWQEIDEVASPPAQDFASIPDPVDRSADGHGTDERAMVPEVLGETPALGGVQWVRPKRPLTSFVQQGAFTGRVQVNEAGAMGLETKPLLAQQYGRLRGNPLRPDVLLDSGCVGDLAIAAASLRGLAHYTHRTVRQDTYALGLSSDEQWLVFVMADGVSSAPFSDYAAEAAAKSGFQAVVRALHAVGSEHVGSIPWQEVIEAMRSAVEAKARGLAPQLDDEEVRKAWTPAELQSIMATTAEILLVETIRSDDRGFRFLRIVGAGDGSCYVMDPERGWKVIGVGKEDREGLISNAVSCFPAHAEAPAPYYGYLDAGQVLLLVTDGYGDLIQRGDTPVGAHLFRELIQPLEGPRFFDQIAFINSSADDDRTILAVWGTEG